MNRFTLEIENLDDDPTARDWADSRFEASLLILADSTAPLRPRSRFWKQCSADGQIAGLAARFDGFDQPSVAIAALDETAFASLVEAAGGGDRITLAVEDRQPIPLHLGAADPLPADRWMTAFSAGDNDAGGAERIEDPAELGAFFRRQGLRFWSEAMLANGHRFGIRGAGGDLVCAAAVNFVLQRQGYGHIGPIATDESHRGRGLAGKVLAAIRSSLAAHQIPRCGLFAEGSAPWLASYYSRRGFAARGAYRFIEGV